jgi:ribose 5-phosphate isomerase A
MREIGSVSLRDAPDSPDGGVIADYVGPIGEPAELAEWLDSVPGVVEHGLFPADMVTTILVGRGTAVSRIDPVSPPSASDLAPTATSAEDELEPTSEDSER